MRRLLLGNAFSALGSGLTMPFLYVYLAQVRGFPGQIVGLTIAWMGLLSFVAAPLGGTLIDRFGPRIVVVLGLLLEAAGVAALAFVETVPQAWVVASGICLGTVALYPSTTALLTRMVAPEHRERAYAVQFMLINAGLGVGGMIASFLVDISSVATFQRLYLLDAASYLGYIAVVATLPAGIGKLASQDTTAQDTTAQGAQPGWREVLADRTLRRIVGVAALAVTFGYAQIEVGFAAYATQTGGVPSAQLGWAFGANTAVIVLGQLVALRLIAGRSRARMLAVAAALWSLSWLVVAASGLVDGWLGVLCVVGGLAVFGLGETLWAPVIPAIVNALALEHLRGRYNALLAMVWTFSSILGPALAGMLLGNGLAGVWVSSVVAGTALAAVLFARLRRHLSEEADGRHPAVSATAGLAET